MGTLTKIEDKMMTKVDRQILENQEIILRGISTLLTPHCKGSLRDHNGETQTNIRLIENYHITRQLLGKE